VSVALVSVGTWGETADLATPYDAVTSPVPAVQEGDTVLRVLCWKDTAAFARESTANLGVGPFRRGSTTATCLSTASTPDAGGMKAFAECWSVGTRGAISSTATNATSGGTGYGIALSCNMVLRGNSGRPVYNKFLGANADTTVNTTLATFCNFTTSPYGDMRKGDLITITAFLTDSTATVGDPVMSGTGWEFTTPVLVDTKVSSVGNKMKAMTWTCYVLAVGTASTGITCAATTLATGILCVGAWGTDFPNFVVDAQSWNGVAAPATPGTSIASTFGTALSNNGVQAGDICFVQVFRRVASAITATPAGWTLVSSTVVGGMQYELWWFTHDGSTANRTISWTTSCQFVWSAWHVRGCDPKNPVDGYVVGTVAVGTSAAVATQTPSQPYCARAIFGGWSGTVNGGVVGVTTPLDPDADLLNPQIASAWTTEPKAVVTAYGVHDLGNATPALPAGNFTWPSNVTAVVVSILLRPGPRLRMSGSMGLASAPKYAQPEIWGSIPL
jgi:hypothetical protein